MLEQKYTDAIKGVVNLDHDPPIACVWVEKLHNHGGKDKRLLLISDSSAYFFSKPVFNPNLIISRHFFWFNLKDIKVFSEFNFQLFFESGDMNILHDEATKILKLILKHLVTILISSELKRLKFDFKKYGIDPGQANDIAIRFRAYTLSQNLEMPDKIYNYLEEMDQKQNYELNLNVLEGNEQYLEALFKAIMPATYIKSIVVPNLQYENFWSAFATFLTTNKSIRQMKLEAKLTEGFTDFCVAINDNIDLDIYSLEFISVDFTPEFIDALSTTVQTAGPRYLYINNSMRPPTQRQLFQRIRQMPDFRSIRVLHLDNTRPLDVPALFTAAANIVSISLVHCEIQIGDFLREMSAAATCNFESVFLGQNLSTKPIDPQTTLPQSLIQLDLSNIEWTLGTFSELFRICSNHKPRGDFHLVVPGAQMSSWDKFFEFLESIQSLPVASIVWDENPLRASFFNLISRCSRLSALSLSNCFTQDDPFLNDLAQLIQGNDTIKNLVMRGDQTKNKALRMSITPIFDALRINRAIRSLDVSGHAITAFGLIELGNVLVANWVLDCVAFDGSDVDSPSIFENFITLLKKRGARLDIVWPENDFRGMTERGLMTTEQMQTIKQGLQSLYVGNQSIPIPDGAYPHTTFNSAAADFDALFHSIVLSSDDMDEEESESDAEIFAFQKAEVISDFSTELQKPPQSTVFEPFEPLPILPLLGSASTDKFDGGDVPEEFVEDLGVLDKMQEEMPKLIEFPNFEDLLAGEDEPLQLGDLGGSDMQFSQFFAIQPKELEKEDPIAAMATLSFDEWSLSLPRVPPINNDEIMDEIAGRFSTRRIKELLSVINKC